MEPIDLIIPFATLLLGMLIADIWLSPRVGKKVFKAILSMPEAQSFRKTLKHLENFMEALDEFGKSEEMKQLARDLGKMYQKVGTMFGLPQEPKEKREEKEYG